MKNTSIKIILFFGGLFSTTALIAQPPPPATPIDGGLSILLVAGGAYGIKKVMDAKKKD